MKTRFIFIALATAAVAASCEKTQLADDVAEGSDVVIFANEDATRTILDAENYKVSWADYENLTVYNAASGTTTYSANCCFVIDDPATGRFVKDPADTGNNLICGADAYDWYVCYPWMQFAANPSGTKGYTVTLAPQQIGYNTTGHIAPYDLLAGKAMNVADGTAPDIALHHVCALMKFTVVNKTGDTSTITGITLDASDAGTSITGSFTMDWDKLCLDPSRMGSSKSSMCELSVVRNTGTEQTPVYTQTDVEVAPDDSVDLYMVVAPFTIPAGKTVRLTIKGGAGNLLLTKVMDKETTFAAGTYNTATLEYSTPEQVVFTETFGTSTVAYANVSKYNKAGLSTAVAAHASDYSYSATGNASFAICTTTNGGIKNENYVGPYLSGAALKLPATSSTATNSGLTIKNIIVEENTTYIFRYNKSKGIKSGAEYDTGTVFKWEASDATEWNAVNQTAEAGTIVQEFTTPEGVNKINIRVEATDRNPASPSIYPAIDFLQLVKK